MAGWIKYDSGDIAIQITNSLASLPTDGEMGADANENSTDVINNSGDYFDGTSFNAGAKGVVGGGVGGTPGIISYTYNSGQLAFMQTEGQLSFDIETEYLTANNTASGSTGMATTGTRQAFGVYSTLNINRFELLQKVSVTDEIASYLFNLATQKIETNAITGITDVLKLHSLLNTDEFTRVNFSWYVDAGNTYMTLGFNNAPYMTAVATGFDLSGPQHTEICFGANSFGAAALSVTGVRFKNFLIANVRADLVATDAPIVLLGDSQTNQQEPSASFSDVPYDCQTAWILQRRLAAEDRYAKIGIYNEGGGYVNASTGVIIGDAINGTPLSGGPNIATAYPDADTAFYIGGTNDALDWGNKGAGFSAAYQSDINELQAAFVATADIYTVNVRTIWARTDLDSQPIRDDRNEANTEITAITGIKSHIDTFTALGGDPPLTALNQGIGSLPDYTFKGQYGGVNPMNDLHTGTAGAFIEGNLLADYYFGILPAGGSPTLTTPYTNINTDNTTSDSIDLGANWTGASTYTITGLPPGATQVGTTGVVNYVATTAVITTLVTVTAINASGMSQSSFNWNVYSAAGVNDETRNTTLAAIVTKLTP